MMKRGFTFFVIITTLLLVCPYYPAAQQRRPPLSQPPTLPKAKSDSTVRNLSAREIAQYSFPAVVLLVMEDASGQPVSLGSGFFVRAGIIATNLHVIEKAWRGYAKPVGGRAKFDLTGVVGLDSSRDLVLLSVENTKVPPLTLGDSDRMAVGDEVYAVGNPRGLEGTFSQGIISAVRQISAFGGNKILQITAPISPGSSGGPVLDSQGRVIGIAVATIRGGQNLNFAIPSGYLSSLLSKTTPPRPLSENARTRQPSSLIAALGERSVDGVVPTQFVWDIARTYPDSAGSVSYSFSVQNKLRDSVRNVYWLVVFYDKNSNPVDFRFETVAELIPAGLAKRVYGAVQMDVFKLSADYSTNGYSRIDYLYRTRVEIRILDFELVQ
jgi:trypsin-like peptidase